MGFARHCDIAALIFLSLTSGAIAAERGASCVGIADSLERLRCFDAAFADLNKNDDPVVTACEMAVQANLVSPATYRRADATIVENYVELAFDSQNYAGGLIRSNVECVFTRDPDTIKLHYPAPTAEMILRGLNRIDISATKMKIPYIEPPKPLQDTGPDAIDFSSMNEDNFKTDCVGRFKSQTKQDNTDYSSIILSEADGSRTVYLRPAEQKEGGALAKCHYVASGRVTLTKLH